MKLSQFMFTVRSLPFIEYFLTLHILFSQICPNDYQTHSSKIKKSFENSPKTDKKSIMLTTYGTVHIIIPEKICDSERVYFE